jgi:hypothetical protein
MTDPPTSGSIYAFREDRLGARLISILSAIRIARRLGKPFKVNWFHATDVGSVFNDPHELFAPDFIRQNWFSGDWPAVMSGADYIANHLPMNAQRLNGMMVSGRNFIESSCLAIPVFDDEDQSQALAEAAAIWAGIPLASEVQAAQDGVCRQIGANGMGYHIRRGDLISDERTRHQHWQDKFVPDELFEQHIEGALSKGARPVLFCDDGDTTQRFTAQFDGLLPVADLLKSFRLTPAQRDLVELCAMAHCRLIVAPPLSAFSTCASIIRGATKVDVSADLPPANLATAFARVAARLQSVTTQTPAKALADNAHSAMSLATFLRHSGRQDELPPLVEAQFKAGGGASFLHPLLAETWLETGNARAALRAKGYLVRADYCRRSDFVTTASLAALANALCDNPETAGHLIQTALSFLSRAPYLAEVTGLLLSAKLLNDDNFLPTTDASRGRLVPFDPDLPRPALGPACHQFWPDGTESLGIYRIDAIVAEWLPLLGGFSIQAHRAQLTTAWATDPAYAPNPDSANPADRQSLELLMAAMNGSAGAALSRLSSLAAGYPNDSMVQHRLSFAHLLHHRKARALHAAETAVSLAPASVHHVAWRGMLRQRTKDHAGAISDLRQATCAGLSTPRVYQILANAARDAHDSPLEAEALHAAYRLAPFELTTLKGLAEHLLQTGQTEQANRLFDRLIRHFPNAADRLSGLAQYRAAG